MEYQLTTLQDVFDKVPADRIGVCLGELAVAMKQTKAMQELLAAAATAVAGYEVGCAAEWPETSTWIDDDKGTLDLKFESEGGDELFDYTVRLATEDKGSNAKTVGLAGIIGESHTSDGL